MKTKMNRTLKPLGSKSGFTLIELLVVIAVLSILLAILVPVATKINKLSEDTTCKTRIRSIATGMMAYYADHQEFPNSQRWVGKNFGTRVNGIWAEWAIEGNVEAGTLWEYVGSSKSYLCPAFERTFDRNPTYSGMTPYASYSMNEYFNPPGRDPNTGNFTRGSWQHSSLNIFHGLRGEVQYANKMALIGEESTWKTPHSNYPLNNLALGVGPWNGGIIDGIASFHQSSDSGKQLGYSNVAFFDLHVGKHHNSESKELFTPEVIKDAIGP